MRKWNRRDFVKGTGLAALFTPFLSVIKPTMAQAVPGKTKYLFVFYTAGTEPSVWSPRGSSSSSISHSPMTEPLSPLNDSLVMVEKLDSNGTAGSHGAPGGLTGATWSGNPLISLEQYASDQLRALGVSTQIPNLMLGGVSSEAPATFYRDNRVLSPIYKPSSAYAAVFGGGGIMLPGDSGISAEAAAEARLRRRQSMLDALTAELSELSSTLGAQERAKLDAHAESLRQLERRLEQQQSGGGGPAPVVQCGTPSDPGDGKDALANSVLHSQLAVNAFACDLTRIAVVEYGHHQNTQVDIPEVGAPGDWHNTFLHSDNPRTRLVNLERWLCKQFVAVADQLKNTPAPDGEGSLFDQTLMLWARDMGDAVIHDGSDMRFVLSGKAGGYLRPGPSYIDGGGQAHSKVLFNALEALGITDYSRFGGEGTGKEPLADIRA